VVKYDVMGTLQSFNEDGTFEWSMNASFLELIPKKVGVVDIKDYRLISLIGSDYKILSKVLKNRLN